MRGSRPARRASRAAAAMLVGMIAGGCTLGSAGSSSGASGLHAVVVSTSTWVGTSTVLIALEESDGSPAAASAAGVTARFSGPAAAPVVDVAGSIVRASGGQRDLVRFDASLPDPGRWQVAVSSGERSATTTVLVRDPGGVPVRGVAAPSVATPTANDVLFDYRQLTADPHPDPAFYGRSVAAALSDGVPFVFVLDSAGFRETPACGSALSILHRTAVAVPGPAIIHAEPYRTRMTAAGLALDPPDGPARLAAWSAAWGLDTAEFGTGSIPWVFVVAGDGVVQATFQGVMGSEEIAIAMADVAD